MLRVDGAMSVSDWTMQRLADILKATVDRPVIPETTALGAAYLAGFASGVCPPPESFASNWQLERRFTPAMDDALRSQKLKGWSQAVKGLLASDN